MSSKRFLDDSKTDPDHPNGKRIRPRPSLSSVIGEVVVGNFFENFCSAFEPILRKVVREEMEQGLRRGGRSLTRSPSFRIHALEPSTLKLIFAKSLSLPIFTGSKIVDIENSSLQILLVDTTSDQLVPASLSHPTKVEIVVLDGDFPSGEMWTSEEFEKKIVRERTGKRPLLAGDVLVTMRNGVAHVGEIEFTDNSSWIRSRKFRIGARVVQGRNNQGTIRVCEAMTEAFVVKDHRGELYRKHDPPMLEDEVWRLEKIGKEGSFHKKLASEAINTVQDLLKLSIVDPNRLRKILGPGMSDKMWEVAIKQARRCILGNKLYISRGPNYTIILNPICQVVKAVINGQTLPTKNLTTMDRAYLENLVREAYQNWNTLEEVDGLMNEMPALTQGEVVEEQYPIMSLDQNQSMVIRSSQKQTSFLNDGSTTRTEVASLPSNANMMECNNNTDWLLNSTLLCSPFDYSSSSGGGGGGGGVRYNVSDSSSSDGGELIPRGLLSMKLDN